MEHAEFWVTILLLVVGLIMFLYYEFCFGYKNQVSPSEEQGIMKNIGASRNMIDFEKDFYGIS